MPSMTRHAADSAVERTVKSPFGNATQAKKKPVWIALSAIQKRAFSIHT